MSIERIKPHLPWITLLILVVIVGIADANFLRPQNLVSMVADIMPLFIMALGLTFAIYIGGIDLSAQSVANMTTVVATVTLPTLGIGAAVVCILGGLVVGALSGFITTKLLVPSFVSTLAVGGVAYSTAQYLSGQRALYMDATLRDASFGWMVGESFGIPHEIFVGAILLLAMLFVQSRTTFGRALKAVGAGELAAVASGLNVTRIKIMAFALSGMLAAIAGLLFSVKLSGGAPTLANGFLLPAIVAVLVGGTPLTGGVGGVVNTLIGTLIVAVIRASMLYFEIDATMQQMVFGIILIVAIALTIDRSKLRIVK
ncbi:ABC transporter permease [Mameliella sediminis]|uniref:ABC transporter permease n=1 Tax=Mameliella sediminis TaxID=2836866 RepID=UPI001C44F0E4|nr:ABC transporter permease [Mameliella sediminis]MBY6116940.1 ABC transporter permease [Antarctobacter heliothermus]MBY6146693.1 ABC transporter permease [Mameliella alba]MBV7397183.1 ABC transporter permease [Mameliella sediminis]MBY6163641.1 ABC transporter permease [Mameliella alba]MBY6172028.1 ABC transporter permease [Mameliella alba]